MVILTKFLIGITSLIYLLLGLTGILLSGTFAAMVEGAGPLAGAVSILPILLIALSILGFWAIIKGNRPGQFAIGIVTLLGWPTGTILGVIIIGLLLMTQSNGEVKDVEI